MTLCLWLKKFEDLLKGTNRKILNILGKQGELFKKFKESDTFFSCQSCVNVYITILKKSTITSSYFKSNFKLIKKVCQTDATCLNNFVQSGEFYPLIILYSLENFTHGQFYLVQRSLSTENCIKSRDVFLVQKLLFSAVTLETFIQCGGFYPVWRLLSSIQTFIQYGDFYGV